MTSAKKSTCRLCFLSILDKNFKTVDDHTKDFLNISLLKLKFDDGSNPVVCSACYAKLNLALKFKSMCLNTCNKIFLYADCEKMSHLDLREVYIKENGRAISHDQKVCVLCMQLVQVEFRCADEKLDVIRKFVPKFSTNIMKDSIICTSCCASLYTHNAFLNHCAELEEKAGRICDVPVSENQTNARLPALFIKTENFEELEGNEMEISDSCVIDYVEQKQKIEIFDIATTESQTDALPSNLFIKSETLNKEPEVNEIEMIIEPEFVEVKAEEDEESNVPQPSLNYEAVEISNNANVRRKALRRQNVSYARTHNCDTCGYKTKNKTRFTAHYLKRRHTSMLCETNIKKPPLMPQKMLENVPMYKCDQCSYETKSKHILLYHHLGHIYPSNIQMKCNICCYTTRSKTNLVYHTLKHKTVPQVRMYRCGFCNYQSRYRSNLTDHQSKHKSGSETDLYKCDSHSKTEQKMNLIDHQITDESLKVETYKCDHQLMQKNHTNVLKDEGSSEARVFKCNDCVFETGNEKYLRAHLLKHKNHLEGHQLIHKCSFKTQMYKCDQCNYESKYKGNLADHQLLHKIPVNELKGASSSESQKYRCNDCDFETKYKKSITAHVLRHKNTSQIENFQVHQVKHKSCSEVQMYKYERSLIYHNLTSESSAQTEMCKSAEVELTDRLENENCSEVQMAKSDENDFDSENKNNVISNVFRAAIKQKIRAILNVAK